MYKCDECDITFTSPGQKANHIRWHHKSKKQKKTIKTKKTFCCVCKKVLKSNKTRRGKRKRFCSIKCANKQIFTKALRKKKSNDVKKAWKNGVYDHISLRNTKKRRFTSRGEEEVRGYFIKNFHKDHLTFPLPPLE